MSGQDPIQAAAAAALSPADPTAETATLDTLIGQVIDGKYRVLSRLGAGGMGAVFKGEHALMERFVALKVLHPHLVNNESLLKRFQHEARVASKLRHPNAIATYDFGMHQGSPYLVMEYVEGRSFKDLIADVGPLPFRRVREIFQEVCSALSQAHSLGIVHRDLKPDNIMLVPQPGGKESAVVLDFGIAKVLKERSGQQQTAMTQAGTFFGTPRYASPEQVLEKSVDKRSDVYSLGIILYEALSGDVPFNAPSIMEILIKHLNSEPVPLRTFKPGLRIPVKLDEVVMKCLRKNPDERFASVEEFIHALNEVDAGDSAPPSIPESIIAAATADSGRIRQTIGAVAVVLLLTGVSAYYFSRDAENQNVRPAVEPPKIAAAKLPERRELPEKQPEKQTELVVSVQNNLPAVQSPPLQTPVAVVVSPESNSIPNSVLPAVNPPVSNPVVSSNSVFVPEPVGSTTVSVTGGTSVVFDAAAARKEAILLYDEGMRFYRQKRYAEAVPRFERAILLRSDAVASRISLGTCYFRLGQNDKALAMLLQAVQLDSRYGPAHYNLAAFYAATGQADLSLRELRQAINLDSRARETVQDDPDFAALRSNSEFRALVQ